jgi:hypothetical protein
MTITMTLERIVYFQCSTHSLLVKTLKKTVVLMALWNFVSWFWTFRVREKLLGHSPKQRPTHSQGVV